ncbi:MAG TPA: exodeoxyribonuclease VII small subunit [Methylomirabilota bacterium]|jgi:hypothetical protein|nr:exodeoxyribonuclease VII small subunit [Methylomirabilota bacterium]
MAEDSTRRLLRVFGIAVTDCEDALGALEAILRGPGSGAAPEQALEAYDRAAREVEARWAEVGGLVQTYQARAREALLAGLRARGGA